MRQRLSARVGRRVARPHELDALQRHPRLQPRAVVRKFIWEMLGHSSFIFSLWCDCHTIANVMGVPKIGFPNMIQVNGNRMGVPEIDTPTFQ